MQKESDYRGNVLMMSTEGYRKLLNSKDGKNVYWTTEINTELPIRMPATGMVSQLKPSTISQHFVNQAKLSQTKPVLKVMRNNKEHVWNWIQLNKDCRNFAKALGRIGVDERKSVNIMGFNAPEWAISFYGTILHNNVVSGVYITNGDDACQYQAEHSEAQAIVVDTKEQLDIYMSILDKLPEVKAIVCWGVDKIPEQYAKDSRIYLWKDFLKLGEDVPEANLDAIIDKQKPG